MLDLKKLKETFGNPRNYRKPQLLTAYTRISKKPLPAAQPWVSEIKENQQLQNFLDDLGYTLKHFGAQSIAAPQVAVGMQIVAIMTQPDEASAERKPFILINPKVVGEPDTKVVVETPEDAVKAMVQDAEAKEGNYETSISYPGVRIKVCRPKSILVSFVDREGAPQELLFEDEEAAGIQQGIETLAGGSILDHVPEVLRAGIIKRGQLKLRKFENFMKAKRGSNLTPAKKKRR